MNAKTFLDGYPSTASSNPDLLDDPEFRDSVYRLLHPSPLPEFRSLIRDMLQKEVSYRDDDSNDGEYFENIYWNALILYQIGDFDDVIPMWRAKHTNMDTGGGFDIQFLVGRGVAETVEFLRQLSDQEADRIADYITQCRDAGDFDHLDEWLADRIEYFS